MAENLNDDNGNLDASKWRAALDKAPKTKPGSHNATQRGYAAGNIIEAGEPVPPGVPISDDWMAKVKGGPDAGERAAQETSQDIKDDPDLTTASKPALEAMAIERGVTSVKGLSKEDLIQAIKSAKDVRA